MFNRLLILSIVYHYISSTAVSNEMEVYRSPGSSVMFLGVDEDKMNITEVVQWEKVPKHTGNKSSMEPVLQFHMGSKNPSLIKKYNGRIEFFPSNGSFFFNNLTSEDEGLYKLSINLRTIIIRYVRLWIMVKLSKPLIWNNSTTLGSTIQVICTVVGDASSYQWRKDGEEISHQLRDGNSSLVILSASKDDCGIYTCFASNAVSSVQTSHTLTIYGFAPVEIIIVVASITGIVFSAISFLGLLLLCCSRRESVQASLKQTKLLFLLLLSCNTMALLATFIALISWIVIKGTSSVSVVSSCGVFILLVLNVSSLWLIITIWNLGCTCVRRFLDCTGLRAFIDVCSIISSVIVIFISIVILVEELQQSNKGCYVKNLTWSILVPIFIIIPVTFSAALAVWYCGNGGTNNETNNEELQLEQAALNNGNNETKAVQASENECHSSQL